MSITECGVSAFAPTLDAEAVAQRLSTSTGVQFKKREVAGGWWELARCRGGIREVVATVYGERRADVLLGAIAATEADR